jgi:hypothetical protein
MPYSPIFSNKKNMRRRRKGLLWEGSEIKTFIFCGVFLILEAQ